MQEMRPEPIAGAHHRGPYNPGQEVELDPRSSEKPLKGFCQG